MKFPSSLVTRRWLPLLLISPLAAHAQTTAVIGNVRDIATVPLTTVTSTQVTFELKNFGGRIPKSGGLAIGNIKVAFKPDTSGNFSGAVYSNGGIDPSGTYYNVCIENNGQAVRCERYLVSGATWVLGTAAPLVVPNLGPNQLVLQTFPCIVTVATTTWTCTHDFNDSPVMVNVFDSMGNQIFPDTTNVANPNVTTITFVTPQSGKALISHAGAISFATNQPSPVLQNAVGGQVIQGPPLAVSSNTAFTGTVTCKNFANVRCIDPTNMAGWTGTTVDAWIRSAQADLGAKGGTIRVAAGSYTLATQLSVHSNITIECDPSQQASIKASASLNATMFSGSSISFFRMFNCTIDGNRSDNANQFGAISFTGVTKSKIINNHFQNFTGGRIINLSSGSNSNTIEENEIDHYGVVLPAVVNGNEAIALAPSGSGAGVQDNDVIHNFIHDGNGGIGVYNSNAAPSVTANTSNNRILDNRIESLPNDAILLFNSNNTSNGSLIQGTFIEGNFIKCNGWPANGTGWDSTNCPPGLLQIGSIASSSGVGIDLNSSLQDQTQVIGNHSNFNFFEGGDDTPQTHTVVSTSNAAIGGCASNCVQWVSGDNFQTNWQTNQGIVINGTMYTILSVQGAQSTLRLNSAPGTQSSVPLVGVTNSRSLWSGNYFSSNGNGAPLGGQGSGLAIMGGQVIANGNFAYNNAFAGFYDQIAYHVTHSGDHSVQNCRTQSCNEFNSQVALAPKYLGITADATNGNNALFFSGNTTNGFAESPSLCQAGAGCGSIAVQDQGTNNVFSDGKTRGASNTSGQTHSLCFAATGGTGCVNYGGGPGFFTTTLPGVNAPLTATIASGTAAMTTALIGAGACGTTVTVSASGVLTTDTITHSFAAAVGANPGLLILNIWPTANNVNFEYCNPTTAGVTPTAATLNWRVVR